MFRHASDASLIAEVGKSIRVPIKIVAQFDRARFKESIAQNSRRRERATQTRECNFIECVGCIRTEFGCSRWILRRVVEGNEES